MNLHRTLPPPSLSGRERLPLRADIFHPVKYILPLPNREVGGRPFLFRLDTVHRVLRGGAPALDADGGEGDGRDGEEGEGEEPPVDGRALGEAH